MNLHLKISLSLIFLFLCTPSHAQLNLFDYLGSTQSSPSKISHQNIIKLSPEIVNLKTSDVVSLSLPNKAKSTFQITSSKNLHNNDFVLTGKSDNNLNLVITVGKEVTYGSIIGPETSYSIGVNQQGQQVLINLLQSHKLNEEIENDFLIPPSKKKPRSFNQLLTRNKNLIETQQKPGDSVIRVLFLYSGEYGEAVPDTTTRFNQMLEFSNDAFTRSGINIELQFAGSNQIAFDNSKAILSLLNEVTGEQGDFDNVDELRNSSYADLVAVIALNSNPFSTSGIAWVNGDDEDYGFSVMRYPVNGADVVFTHEIGHNLGSGHEHISANPSQSSPCDRNYTGYSCGHGFTNPDPNDTSNPSWGTIMSYLSRWRVGYIFSDPTKTCLGRPCGIAAGQTNAADNVTSFNLSRLLVKDFRDDPPIVVNPPNSNDDDTFCLPLKSSNNKTAVVCL